MNILLAISNPVEHQLVRNTLSESFSDWKIVAVVQSLEVFRTSWKNHSNVDLILSDIEFSEGLIFKELSEKKIQTPVIFLAASEHYAFQSFEHNCVDYLLKPLDEKRLFRAFQKVIQLKSTSLNVNLISNLLANQSQKTFKKRFLTRLGNRFSFVTVDNVGYFYSEEGMTYLVENGSTQRQLIDHTLTELESEFLDPMKFYRVNRGMIINLESLIEIKPYYNGRLVLSMNCKSDDVIVVARERVNEFKNWINQ